MYCLDTNIVIDFLTGDLRIKEFIDKIDYDLFEVCLTPITLCELYKGAYLSNNTEKSLEGIRGFLMTTLAKIIHFNDEACRVFGEEYVNLKKKGRLTNEFDLLIASIVKAYDLILVTRDKKHFEDLGLKVEVW